jgi:hypothetical protein
MTAGYESLQTIVGQETYNVWKKMLRELVPDGRTHRLAPMVAGMLQYAAAIAYEMYGDDPEEGSVAHIMLLASEVYDPNDAIELLGLLTQLFEDAGVGHERANRQGDEYSIAESVVYEFIHWYDMPWEA